MKYRTLFKSEVSSANPDQKEKRNDQHSGPTNSSLVRTDILDIDDLDLVNAGAGSPNADAYCPNCRMNRKVIIYSGDRKNCSVCGSPV